VEGADALGLIAEVGIAIAGFAGVVAALRAPAGRMAGYAAVRIGSLLAQSGTAVLMALVPFALHQAGLSSAATWRLSSALMLALIGMMTLWFSTFGRRARGDTQPQTGRIVMPIMYTLTTVGLALQGANIAFMSDLWPFYVGLLILTALSLLNFAYILLAPGQSEVPA
jgi:hypothetical protein